MKENKRNLIKSLLIICILIATSILLPGCGRKKDNNEAMSDDYKAPIINYFDGIKNKDVSQMLKAFPDFMKMEENIDEKDIEDLYAQYQAVFGENIEINYELGEPISISDEDISQMESDISDYYKDIEKVDLTAGYIVPVTVKIGAKKEEAKPEEENKEEQTGEPAQTEQTEEQNKEDEKSTTEQQEMHVYQYNGNWYLF